MNGLPALNARRASMPMPIIPTLSTVSQSPQAAPLNRVYWIRKEEPMHRPHKVSTKILGLGVFMVGVVLLTIGLIIGLEFPVYVTDKIERDQCILDKDHAFYDKWSTDEEWSRLNRLYYWQLANPEEFRQGEAPRFVERGPYVYKEDRQYVNVEFSGTRMSYQTMLKQTFAADLTRKECGNTCTETDQLTVLNTELMQRLHQDSGWDGHIFKQIPGFIRSIIRRLEEVAQDESVLYEYLGCINEKCDNQTLNLAQKEICDNISVSFGIFLQQNVSVRSHTIKKFLNNSIYSPLNVILLKSVYNHLMMSNFDSGNSVEYCVTDSDNADYNFYWTVEGTGSYNDTLSNSLNSSLNKNETFLRIDLTTDCSTVSATHAFRSHMLTFSGWHANWSINICSEGTKTECHALESDFETILSFFIVISDFVKLYLLQTFDIWYKSQPGNQIYYTMSQRKLALGYTTEAMRCGGISTKAVNGILKSHSMIDEVFFTSPKISISTCLEEGNTDNNMIVREYNGSQFAPPGVHADIHRTHFGFTSYLPPSDHCRACARPYPNNQTYKIFNGDLYRSITFEEKHEMEFKGYRLYRYQPDPSSFSSYQHCNLIDTTSVLRFPSFSGIPYYDGSGCNYLQNLVTGTSWDRISYLEVEPWTGRVWKQSMKLQTSTVIRSDLRGGDAESPFEHVNYIGVPLPVYWVDKYAEISQQEIDYFGYKIVRLMSVSCGGLIGLTVAALLTMGFSLFVGLLSTRKNRIEPLVEAGRTNSLIHGP